MKLGIIFSLVIVFLAILVGVVGFYGFPQSPTIATRPEKLVKLSLPADLPLFTPTQPAADGAEFYSQALQFYQDHHDEFSRDVPRPQVADELTDLLISAMNCGKVRRGFLDDRILMEPGALPGFGDALEQIPAVVLRRGQAKFDEGDKDRALQSAHAIWVLGKRAYSDNIRLYNRRTGLDIMTIAGAHVFQWSPDEDSSQHSALTTWARKLDEISDAFNDKDTLINRIDPHVGDLLNIALNDEDVAFRVEAILKLGVVKFSPGTRGNDRVIRRTIAQAAKDPDPLIAKAGAAADEFTLDQLRKLR